MYRRHVLLSIVVCLFLAVNFFTPQTDSQSTKHSLSLDGTNDYLSAPSSTSLNISGSITIEAWIKANTTSSGVPQAIISREAFQQAGTGGGYRLALNQNARLRLDLFQSHNTYTTAVGATTVTANTWHHVAGVFDGSQMRVYLDGVLDGSVSTTSGPASGTGSFYLGRFSNVYDPIYFGGLIDEARVSAAALYTSNFTAGLGPGSNVRGYWKFDGQTPNDDSGNANNGTLQNGATYSTTVPPSANTPPTVSITDPLNNTNFAPGSNIVIDATAADSDGSVAQVEFYQGTTLLGTDSSSPYQFIWTPSAGQYSLTAKASDNESGSTTSTAVNVTVSTGGNGNSLSLDGTNDYLSAPSSTSLNISGSITIEAWIKANTTSSGVPQAIISREAFQQAGTGGGYRLALNQNAKLRLDLFQSHNTYTTAVGATTVTANTWHHVAGVFDGSQMRLYLDGVLDGSVSTTSGPASGSGSFYIGRFSNVYDPIYFGGLIDEVRVSAVALYTSNFTAGLGPGSNVRGYWKFDGQTPNDDSGNANHGTLQNGATYSTTIPPIQSSQRPVPNAGGPYSGSLGQSIQFSSSGSADPDGTLVSYRWNFGDGTVATTANPTHTYATAGTFTATLTLTDNSGLLASATAPVTISGASLARLDPRNQTGGGGENPLSQNYNWTLPILNLPGRAGMGLGLSLSYNSLVWTRNGNNISFDDDRGFPSPGFHLGFPAIQGMHFNSETGKWAYLLIGSDGSRTELRQAGSSVYFESADSAHTLLDTSLLGDPNNPRMLLRATDGTQLTYKFFNYGNSNNYGVWSGFECTEIKDPNGNYITVNYNATGNISSIIDTLGRTINFVYQNGSLAKIEQQWSVNGATATHTWATFDYTNITITTAFSGVSVSGPANGPLKMLSKVTLDDNSDTSSNNSHIDFDYTPWGQVWKISNYAADNHLLSYRSYKLPNSPLFANPPAQTDCPRFNERRDWGQYANDDTDSTPVPAEEVVTTFADPWTETWTMPTGGSPVTGMVAQVGTKLDATSYVSYDQIYYIGTTSSEGWRRGLPALIKTFDKNVLQRQAVTLWEQDDQTKSYLINPRVKESWIIDSANQKRTAIEYEQFSLPNNLSCKLPSKVLDYGTDTTTVERSTWTSYLMTATYKDRHILGLVSESSLRTGGNGAQMSLVNFFYDESGSIVGSEDPTQHDNTNYTSSFVAGRGNLSKVKRIDVTSGEFTQSTFAYNNSGSMVSAKDHLNHETVTSYVDSFSDKTGTATYAYPTAVTDPGGAINKQTYDFDFGGVTSRQGTAPNQTTYSAGATQSFEYYPHGALKEITNSVNSAHLRYEYSSDKLVVKTFATIEDGEGETLSFVYTDGFGRRLGIATTHQTAASEFKFSGQRFKYDAIGRPIETSNPTETTAIGVPFDWDATGDDDVNDWVVTKQTYDWKGRPLVTTNPSLTSDAQASTTRSIVYTGCGCAGGEVATITDEGTVVNGVTKTRQQKIYSDIFGRTVKAEVYDFEGTASGGGRQLYSTTIANYNIRDQVTLSREFAGSGPTDSSDLSCPSGTCQRTEMTYDGFGRLKTSHDPVQQPEPNNYASSDHTTFYYNGDDTIAYLSDSRGVVKTFTYNNRRQVTGVSYNLGNIPTAFLRVAPTSSVTFEYDKAGNRTRMIDGTGNISYHYDGLTRLDSETRQFAGSLSSNSYTLTYSYNLGNQIKQMTDHTGTVTTYDHNKAGQLEKVSGNLIPQVNDYATGYRYRAWGGIKEVNYSNSSSQNVQYNRRLLPTAATLNNVQADNMSQIGNLSWSYSYYPDGSQKGMSDTGDNRFDRLFEYDFAGRLKEAYSGREARGQAASTPNADSPFRHTYNYNAFNEPTSKNGRFWRTEQTGPEPCVPRTSTDGCDANGNVLTTNYGAQTYDAEDRQVRHANHRYQVEVSQGWFEPAIEIEQTYDGVGQVAKRDETRRREVLVNGGPATEVDTSVTTTYYIYSTALGGAKVIELAGDGQKDTTYVYANGVRVGKDKSGVGFSWNHVNPGSNSWVESYSGGLAFRQEMDPDGAEVGTVDPMSQVLVPEDLTYEKWHDEQPLYIEGGDPFDFVSGYTLDGLPMTRGELARQLNKVGPAGLLRFRTVKGVGYVIPEHIKDRVSSYSDAMLSEFLNFDVVLHFRPRFVGLALQDLRRLGQRKTKPGPEDPKFATLQPDPEAKIDKDKADAAKLELDTCYSPLSVRMDEEIRKFHADNDILLNVSIINDMKRTIFVAGAGVGIEVAKQAAKTAAKVAGKTILRGGVQGIIVGTVLEIAYNWGANLKGVYDIIVKYEPEFRKCDEAVEDKYRITFRAPGRMGLPTKLRMTNN